MASDTQCPTRKSQRPKEEASAPSQAAKRGQKQLFKDQSESRGLKMPMMTMSGKTTTTTTTVSAAITARNSTLQQPRNGDSTSGRRLKAHEPQIIQHWKGLTEETAFDHIIFAYKLRIEDELFLRW